MKQVTVLGGSGFLGSGLADLLSKKTKKKVIIFDMKGNKLSELTNINQIDFSTFANGIYNLSISYNGALINHRIIKQ